MTHCREPSGDLPDYCSRVYIVYTLLIPKYTVYTFAWLLLFVNTTLCWVIITTKGPFLQCTGSYFYIALDLFFTVHLILFALHWLFFYSACIFFTVSTESVFTMYCMDLFPANIFIYIYIYSIYSTPKYWGGGPVDSGSLGSFLKKIENKLFLLQKLPKICENFNVYFRQSLVLDAT